MANESYLQLGNFIVDPYRDRYLYLDYSKLFQNIDAFEIEYLLSDYFGYDDVDEEPVGTGTAYKRPLRDVATRLDLLGFSFQQVRRMYEGERADGPIRPIKGYEWPPEPAFEALVEAFLSIDWSAIDEDHPARGVGSPWANVADYMVAATDEEFRIKYNDARSRFEMTASNLDPFSVLQILAQQPQNLDLPVIWNAHSEILEEFLPREEISLGAGREDRFLIVTEGSTDTTIIRRALELICPHAFDFFNFIDMDKNYPLTGTGNLHNFYQGLLKIGILNNIVFIYDNDTEGCAKLAAAAQLASPSNIRTMKLPDMPEFEMFATVGPTGEQAANINGKAASIECYLDLSWQIDRLPRVRWTGYHAGTGNYQGEIEDKQSYVRRFLAVEENQFQVYDMHKLEAIVDNILTECILIATTKLDDEWSESL